MQLSRPSNMQHLAFSKLKGLTSLYLVSLLNDSHYYICMVDYLGLLKINPNLDWWQTY